MHRVVVWIQQVLVPVLGPAGILVVSFFDSSVLSLPEINDLLVVTSSAARPGLAWLYALAATLGSVMGCALLWAAGRRGGEAFLLKRLGRERMERTRHAFRRWDALALAIPAILPPPLPFKIFVLSAGVFGFPWRRCMLTLLLARGFRYSGWAALGVAYGDEALVMLRAVDGWVADNLGHLLALLALGVAAVALAVVWRSRRRRGPEAPGPG